MSVFWRPRGCVLWLDFATLSGSIAYDLSGQKNNGTIYGATWKRGYLVGAVSFDGEDDLVVVPDSPSLRPTTAVTIEGFLMLGESTTLQVYDWREYLGKTGRFTFTSYIGDDYIRFFIDGADGIRYGLVKDVPLDIGKWQHLVACYDKAWGEIRLYKNAELIGARAMAVDLVDSTDYHVRVWYPYFVKGQVSFTRMYNRGLTEREIKAHYHYLATPMARVPA